MIISNLLIVLSLFFPLNSFSSDPIPVIKCEHVQNTFVKCNNCPSIKVKCTNNGNSQPLYIMGESELSHISLSYADKNGRVQYRDVSVLSLLEDWDQERRKKAHGEIPVPLEDTTLLSINEINDILKNSSERLNYRLGLNLGDSSSLGIRNYYLSPSVKAYASLNSPDSKELASFLKEKRKVQKLSKCYWTSETIHNKYINGASKKFRAPAKNALSCEKGLGVCFGTATCNLKEVLGSGYPDLYEMTSLYCSTKQDGQCPEATVCAEESTSNRKISQRLPYGIISIERDSNVYDSNAIKSAVGQQ